MVSVVLSTELLFLDFLVADASTAVCPSAVVNFLAANGSSSSSVILTLWVNLRSVLNLVCVR